MNLLGSRLRRFELGKELCQAPLMPFFGAFSHDNPTDASGQRRPSLLPCVRRSMTTRFLRLRL